MTRYADIIERLTEATGPDRELDAAIIVAATPAEGQGDDLITLRRTSESDECAPGTYWRVSFSGKSLRTSYPYTASIDAAVALVERLLPGCHRRSQNWNYPPSYAVSIGPSYVDSSYARHACEPIAILLALFRALQAQEESR